MYSPLTPHSYPPHIKIFILTILSLFLYSVYLAPAYFVAAKNLKSGEHYLQEKNYEQAIAYFEKVIEQVPSGKKAKILLAITYFSNQNETDDQEGLKFLQGVKLNKYDWKEIEPFVPADYQQFFEKINQ